MIFLPVVFVSSSDLEKDLRMEECAGHRCRLRLAQALHSGTETRPSRLKEKSKVLEI